MPDRNRPDSDGGGGSSQGQLTRSAAVVIAVTLQRLVDNATQLGSVEERLVLDALRRSAGQLKEASTKELAEYVSGLSPVQLRGVAANVKGIYHELLFVHSENLDADGVEARVFEATNRPGADVEFLVDGEVIHTVQLKAVASAVTVYEHLARYPDIEVVATAEIAGQFPDVASSGFTNDDLTGQVEEVFSELPGDGPAGELAEGMAASALLSGAAAAAQVLRTGRVSRQQFATALGDVSVGVVTATALDVLLDGFS